MGHGHPNFLPDMFVGSLSASTVYAEIADRDYDNPHGDCIYFYRVAGFREYSKGRTAVQKRIDDQSAASGTTYMYVGLSDPGTLTGSGDWSIKRVTFVDGDPVAEEWSEPTASWIYRTMAVYR